jgi:hypothetical protein
MENRDREKVNNKEPTEADDTARKKPEDERIRSDSDADFGENIRRSDLWDNEPSPRKEGGRLGDGRSDVGRTGTTSHLEH